MFWCSGYELHEIEEKLPVLSEIWVYFLTFSLFLIKIVIEGGKKDFSMKCAP